MRPSSLVRTLLSGAVFYVVMAACAASDRAGGFTADGGGLDAIVDGVVDPVGEASAADPDVAEEPCDKVLKYNGQDAYVAEHAYPGKSAIDLAELKVVVSSGGILPGYDRVVGFPYVRDGSAAVLCGLTASGKPNTTVVFVLP